MGDLRSDSCAYLTSQSYIELRAMYNHPMEILEKSDDDDVGLRSEIKRRRTSCAATPRDIAVQQLARRACRCQAEVCFKFHGKEDAIIACREDFQRLGVQDKDSSLYDQYNV